MKVRRSPTDQELREWLDGGGTAEMDALITTSPQCAERLEKLAADTHPSTEAESETVSQVLAKVLEPPEDLTDRLEQRVVARLNSRELLGVFADLFGAGLETSKLLFTGEPTDGNS